MLAAPADKDPVAAEKPPAESSAIVVPVIDLKGLLPPKTEAEQPETPPEPSFGTHLLDWLTENGGAFAQSWQAELNGLVNLPQLSKFLL